MTYYKLLFIGMLESISPLNLFEYSFLQVKVNTQQEKELVR